MKTWKYLAITTFSLVAFLFAVKVHAQKVPSGQPFQSLQQQIDQLKQQVAALAAGGAQRRVISGSINLNADGDVIFESKDGQGQTIEDHFKVVFRDSTLTLGDLPSVTLYQRRRVTAPVLSPPFNGFVVSDFNGFRWQGFVPDASVDMTRLFVEDERILVRYRRDRYETDGTITKFFGLDGQGGTGEFNLVLIR